MAKKKILEWQNCSEEDLRDKVRTWCEVQSFTDPILFLEGEMGSGKSTFARVFLSEWLGVQRSSGSPTYPLVQEYEGSNGKRAYHIDLYRLKNEDELVHSGIESQIEEAGVLTLIEWASLFQDSFAHFFDEKRLSRRAVFEIQIEPSLSDSGKRTYCILSS